MAFLFNIIQHFFFYIYIISPFVWLSCYSSGSLSILLQFRDIITVSAGSQSRLLLYDHKKKWDTHTPSIEWVKHLQTVPYKIRSDKTHHCCCEAFTCIAAYRNVDVRVLRGFQTSVWPPGVVKLRQLTYRVSPNIRRPRCDDENTKQASSRKTLFQPPHLLTHVVEMP